MTKAIEALVAVNTRAVAAQRPEQQATVFQVRALLTDPAFRQLVVATLDAEARKWWTGSFPDLPRDALATVLNPLERLGASPVVRAFLGCPVSAYDIRRAMDEGQVLWICPPGTGPTNSLLISLIVHDFLRAGLSRRDLPENRRRPFRFYLDEMISLDHGESDVLAQITEQLRKFGCRMHGMTQLMHRLSPSTRAALMQNASCLSTTAGSVEAITQITSQWPDTVTPATSLHCPGGGTTPASPSPAGGSDPSRSGAPSCVKYSATAPGRLTSGRCAKPHTPPPQHCLSGNGPRSLSPRRTPSAPTSPAAHRPTARPQERRTHDHRDQDPALH